MADVVLVWPAAEVHTEKCAVPLNGRIVNLNEPFVCSEDEALQLMEAYHPIRFATDEEAAPFLPPPPPEKPSKNNKGDADDV